MTSNSWMDSKEGFASWTADQVAQYFKEKENLGDYYEMILNHKVTGDVAPHLSDRDLKEMGVESIGDRKRFLKVVSELGKEHRRQEREKVIWEGTEVMWFSCWQAACATCCGCCPVDPSEYKLTGTHLVIKTINPCRFGPCSCSCCHAEYHVDNIDLTHVNDADVKGIPAPCLHQICCCGKARDHIRLKTSAEGEKLLKLKKGEGETVARLITNQVEEAQKIERD